MSVMPVTSPSSSPFSFPADWTMADVQDHLGEIPLDRIRVVPPKGIATEKDLLAVQAREGRICELVDGVLVEKAVGYLESRLAMLIGFYIQSYLIANDLGVLTGEAGLVRLAQNQVRAPDVAFFGWHQFPDRKMPQAAIPTLRPDLAIEVISKSNTASEMRRKVHEYFAAGTQLVWLIDPERREARSYTAPEQFTVVAADEVLDGAAVLPGFSLSLAEVFMKAGV